jgi:hypothetical protein
MFTYYYTCPDGQMSVSLASLEILHLEDGLEEIRVHTSNKQYDIMLVFGYLGKFVYIPENNFGFPAGNLLDTENSMQYLESSMDDEGASAVAAALQFYMS